MTSTAAPPLPAYRNRDLPAEQRVADLLARMTLDEKAAQMRCVWRRRAKAATLVDADGAAAGCSPRASFGAPETALNRLAGPVTRGPD